MVTKDDFLGGDFVSIKDLSVEEIDFILEHAREIEENFLDYRSRMQGRLFAPLFFERSTRTDISFQSAIAHMGGRFLDFDEASSSVGKGETLRDTVKTIERYRTSAIVARHNLDGSATLVADSVQIPVINAGDGKNEHPTQTLLDLYTIKELRGKLSGTRIAIAGDLKLGRTVHSLSYALSLYEGCEMDFISSDSLKMPQDLIEDLKKRGVRVFEYGLDRLENLAESPDLLYMTRIQRERFPQDEEGKAEYKRVCSRYNLRVRMLEGVGNDFRILHPLPKVGEIDLAIDDTPYAYYFSQLENGLYVRMALLDLLVGDRGSGSLKNE
ncbi:aspartate carbamoyltransferase [Candidatus Pacearchaeota archaeon]|nr:aspartate carbamoyltransferase [Candidatus Pacearchaeota archaeon]MBD3283439.1 aspartate carbamoyltransferase [Candidatus Pacearchaeota archaeon]